jgi:hypothetical protein
VRSSRAGTVLAIPLRVINPWGSRGTGLIEAVIAIGLLTGAVLLFASLASLSIRADARSRERNLAALLAAQKLESLAVAPQALALSPAGSLFENVPSFVDLVDAAGRSPDEAKGVVFVRRWSVTAFDGDDNLLIVSVDVAPCRRRASQPWCGDPDARVRLTTVRSKAVR